MLLLINIPIPVKNKHIWRNEKIAKLIFHILCLKNWSRMYSLYHLIYIFLEFCTKWYHEIICEVCCKIVCTIVGILYQVYCFLWIFRFNGCFFFILVLTHHSIFPCSADTETIYQYVICLLRFLKNCCVQFCLCDQSILHFFCTSIA